MKRQCKVCGKEFTVKKTTQNRYCRALCCSRDCSNIIRADWTKQHIRKQCVLVKKDECVRCTSHKYMPNGYHGWSIDGKKTYLHKVLCPGKEIRHLCGNKWCLNKAHLVAGTHKENMNDAVVADTIAFGQRHGMNKLSPEEVIEIRSLRGKLPQWKIGKMFDIHQVHVSQIQLRKIWRRLE